MRKADVKHTHTQFALILYASHKEYKKVCCWNELNLVETEDQGLNIDKCKTFLKKVLLNTSSGFFK